MFFAIKKEVIILNVFKRIANKFKSYSKTKKTVISIVAVLLVLLIIALSTFFIVFRYKYNGMFGISGKELGVTEENLPDGVTNIALFGVDTRSKSKFTGNTDSIMILSVDTVHKKIKITSVMRDSLVNIKGYSPYKINSAYAKGGPSLAINTLNTNFGLNITEYATINFSGMSKIIDAVGGVEVELTAAEVKDANIHIKYMADEQDVKPTYIEDSGKQLLNGLQAVSFTRIRHVATVDGVNNDYGRTDRQRYVMNQLFNKALTLSTGELTKLIKTCLPYVETSLDYFEILKLAGVLTIDGIQFSQMRIPQQDYVISGMNVRGGATVYYSLNYAKDVLHAYIYDDMSFEEYKAENGIDKIGWYDASKYSNNSKIEETSSEIQHQNEMSSYYQMIESEYNMTQSSSDTQSSSSDIASSSSQISSSSSQESSSSSNTSTTDDVTSQPNDDVLPSSQPQTSSDNTTTN